MSSTPLCNQTILQRIRLPLKVSVDFGRALIGEPGEVIFSSFSTTLEKFPHPLSTRLKKRIQQ